METTPFLLEKITWIDSALNFASSWLDLKAIEDRCNDWNGHSITVGFNVYESNDRVALAQTLDGENPNGANVHLIYKPCIIEREVLA